MRKFIAAVALTVMTVCTAVSAQEVTDKISLANERGKVKEIVVTIEYPNGETKKVPLDFCLPNQYQNVELIAFGDHAVRVVEAGTAALYPHLGNTATKIWNNKVKPDDPYLPTYLLLSRPEVAKKQALTLNTQTSSVKVIRGANGPTMMASCGGYNHDPD